MPWRASRVVDERKRFVLELESGERMAEVCRRFGISRKTGYKILERWKAQRDAGLLDRDRTPLRVPHRTPTEVVELVLEVRREHPTWGARKLRAVLEPLHPGVRLPCASTIDLILRRHQLVVPRRRRRLVSPYTSALRQPVAPNDLWCADYKGQFRLGCGSYCYPLTISDQVSRFLLACEALDGTEGGATREVFEQIFAEYGLPWAIRRLETWHTPGTHINDVEIKPGQAARIRSESVETSEPHVPAPAWLGRWCDLARLFFRAARRPVLAAWSDADVLHPAYAGYDVGQRHAVVVIVPLEP